MGGAGGIANSKLTCKKPRKAKKGGTRRTLKSTLVYTDPPPPAETGRQSVTCLLLGGNAPRGGSVPPANDREVPGAEISGHKIHVSE